MGQVNMVEKYDSIKINNTNKSLSNHEYGGNLNFEVPMWGIKDFINERNFWLKGTNLTHGNEPGWFYFKVFFKFNTGYGLFGGIFSNKGESKDNTAKDSYLTKLGKEIVGQLGLNKLGLGKDKKSNKNIVEGNITHYYGINSATQYLSSLADIGMYKSLKLRERLMALYKFSSLLFELTIKTPWSIKGISNLQEAFNVNINNLSDEKSFDLLFNTETVDMRLTNLMDLYKYACYDDINCKEILPQNLRKFDMSIIIFHMPLKYIQTGISVLKFGDTEKKFNMLDDICTVANKQFGQFGNVNKGINVVQDIANVVKAFTTKSLLYDYKTLYANDGDFSNMMSYKMLTFHNCEIDTSSFGRYVENVEIKNETPFQFGNTALKIKYDRVYYHNMNEWNQYMFGSDGFHYNENVPENLTQNITDKNNEIRKELYKNAKGNDSKWNERIKALSDVSEAGLYNNPISDTQWKNLLDYSEIAIMGSLKDFDMEDLIVPDRGVMYNTKTGNIYENYTKTSKYGSDYFKDKNELLVKQYMIGNIFGDLCNNITSEVYHNDRRSGISRYSNTSHRSSSLARGHISKYYDFKLSKLGEGDNNINDQSVLNKLVNDALTTFSTVTNEKTTLIDEVLFFNEKSKQNNNLYGNYGPKHILTYELYNQNENIRKQMSSWDFEEYKSYISSTNINYFDNKYSRLKNGTVNGNIHENNPVLYTDSYGTKRLTNYYENKLKYLAVESYDNIIKLEGNLYNRNLMAYGTGSRQYTDYFNNKFESLITVSNIGNIHSYNVSTYAAIENNVNVRKNTELFNYKINELLSSTSLTGNIYDFDIITYKTGDSRTVTEYFRNKINDLKKSSLNGNIYDFDIITYKTGDRRTVTEYFTTKISELLSSTSLTGNIYDYDFVTYKTGGSRTVTKLFEDKITNLKSSSLTGNIYDYDFVTYKIGDSRTVTEYFKNKIQSTYNDLFTSYNLQDTHTNIFDQSIKYDENGNVITRANIITESSLSDAKYNAFEENDNTIHKFVLSNDYLTYNAYINSFNELYHYDENGNLIKTNLLNNTYLNDVTKPNTFVEYSKSQYIDPTTKLQENKNPLLEPHNDVNVNILVYTSYTSLAHENKTYILNINTDTYSNNLTETNIGGIYQSELLKHSNNIQTSDFRELSLHDNIIATYFNDSLKQLNTKEKENYFNGPLEWAQLNVFDKLKSSSDIGNFIGSFL